MYLVYLGESGNTGSSANDPAQQHHVHAGLLVHENQYISVNGEFDALCRRHLGSRLGEMDTPSQLRPADIFQGRHYFSSWPQAKRAELIQDCLSILIRKETPAIVAYIDKKIYAQGRSAQDGPGSRWTSPSEPVIGRFLFALNMYMDEMSLNAMDPEHVMDAEWPIKDYTMVVADSANSVEPRFMAEFIQSESDLPTPAILENFHYAGPQRSPCTQLANMCAYFVRRWLQNPSGSHGFFDALQENRVIQVIYPVQL